MKHTNHLLLALGALITFSAGCTAEPDKPKTMNSTNLNSTNKTELATLGGGCFWCLEASFELLPGVKAVVNGYAGGRIIPPTRKSAVATVVTPRSSRLNTTRKSSPTKNCWRRSGKSTTPPLSIARVTTVAHNIAP